MKRKQGDEEKKKGGITDGDKRSIGREGECIKGDVGWGALEGDLGFELAF